MADSVLEDRVGEILNDTYRLEGLIGEGGMGSVYEATHLRVPRRFAVKFLSQAITRNEQAYARFRREAEIASSLGHENIVQVFDFNESDDGVPYMVLELLEGEDLSSRLRAVDRLSTRRVASLLIQIAGGLQAAHDAGVVHRDLKPANLFLVSKSGRDTVKILDFGISKVLGAETLATDAGTIFGTPEYMAPEQAQGRDDDVDGRTDVFALAVIVYECITGVRPFAAEKPISSLYRVCHDEPAPVSQLVPALPPDLDGVMARAMAKEPTARTPSAIAFRDEYLEATRAGSRSDAAFDSATPVAKAELPPTTPIELRPPLAAPAPAAAAVDPAPARRRRSLVAAAAIAVVAIGVVIAVAMAQDGGDSTQVAAATPDAAPPVPAATPDAALALAATDAAAAASRAIPPPPQIDITLDVRPRGAQLFLDGEPFTGDVIQATRSDSATTLTARKRGYRPGEVTFALDRDRTVRLRLERKPHRPRDAKAGLYEREID